MSYKKQPGPTYARRRKGTRSPLDRTERNKVGVHNGSKVASSVYIPHFSKEFKDVDRFIQTDLGKNVYLIGVRAMSENAVPLLRFTDGIMRTN